IAVVVHRTNKVPWLTQGELREIFSHSRVQNWQQVRSGGASSVQGPINCYVRDDKSGTRDVFEDQIMDGAPMQCAVLGESDDLVRKVEHDTNGIAFVGRSFAFGTNIVRIGERDEDALFPGMFPIKTEDYVLSRRLYAYSLTDGGKKAATAF